MNLAVAKNVAVIKINVNVNNSWIRSVPGIRCCIPWECWRKSAAMLLFLLFIPRYETTAPLILKYSSRIKTACLYFKYSSLLNQLPIRVIKMSWISLKTTEFSLGFFFSLTNLYCKLVATLFQQLVIMEDVFALLVSSMLASCYKVVELNVLVTSCSDNLLSFCNSTTCQQVLSDNLVASSW